MPFIINDVPIECINHAAATYQVPASMIISVLKTEGGKNGLASRNKNGSYDHGPMQINSAWLNKIRPYGYSQKDVQYKPCINVAVGAWILREGILDGKNYWNGVGNYHSHTPNLNQNYSVKIYRYYSWLTKLLNPTINYNQKSLDKSRG
jgi:hypothetical protein